MRDFETEYRIETSFGLAIGGFPELLVKDWERFLDKTYRINVQDNDNWPSPPDVGWLTPLGWFSEVKDVVRTLFVVKYLDGVDYLGARIEAVAKDSGLRSHSTLQSTELGYYAAHVLVWMKVEIPSEHWAIETRFVSVELQITTQVQEVIRRLLHPHYERHQSQLAGNRPWQWEYDGREFSANYLGHILHYVEGQIMKVREEED